MTAPRRPATQLLTVKETADRLSCSIDHVYDLVSTGALRSVQIARSRAKTRIREDDLADFIDSRTHRVPHLRRAI